ncbi:hypothetical protein QQF64_023397 [Cirrhinus molitorella]|uniref:Uncharacterized protein n=1 Tax=Cirrhinus molitorella TaxID=172907 RepID=A0ABR3L7P9_9TELE
MLPTLSSLLSKNLSPCGEAAAYIASSPAHSGGIWQNSARCIAIGLCRATAELLVRSVITTLPIVVHLHCVITKVLQSLRKRSFFPKRHRRSTPSRISRNRSLRE